MNQEDFHNQIIVRDGKYILLQVHDGVLVEYEWSEI